MVLFIYDLRSQHLSLHAESPECIALQWCVSSTLIGTKGDDLFLY